MKNLGELNKLYNFQDTIVLCEIFESCSSYLNKIFKYNPRKCNSASCFSRCVHWDKSKCCIALPTDQEMVKIFEKIIIGSFSGANTRLASDLQILFPKIQRDKMKLIYKIKTGDGTSQNKRISTKILKIAKSNQLH